MSKRSAVVVALVVLFALAFLGFQALGVDGVSVGEAETSLIDGPVNLMIPLDPQGPPSVPPPGGG
jgi:hypothetical protein